MSYVQYSVEQALVHLVAFVFLSRGPFFVAYQNLRGRCLVCKHGSHVINIPKADWSSVKNKQLTATPC